MCAFVRFLDTPLLPASAAEDFPKVIAGGIDEEGQHKNSPAITGPDGAVTLLHQLGRPELIERFLDVEGTMAFMVKVKGQGGFHDAFIKRIGIFLEIGLLDSDGEADPSVVYEIKEPDERLPYKTGPFVPSTSYGRMYDSDKPEHIRFQGSVFTKAIWWHKYYKFPVMVDWSGMTREKSEELKKWDEERRAALKSH
ncbi:hypothetical protein AURDEDRAFT_159998 [Auricularia subglabra TFB-10046 SS5]|nr:hypothetical protein AURDEDRAFT_159998 [Auricularia subglabra TFB-10046 SS5]